MNYRTAKKNRITDYIVLAVCVISSLVLVSMNGKGREPAIYKWTLELTNAVLSPVHNLQALVKVRDDNISLRNKLILLQMENARLAEAFVENSELKDLLDIKTRLGYQVTGAKVTGFGGESGVRTFIINAGEKSGIQVNMPVIGAEGLAGKIIRVADNYSVGQLVIDKNFSAAARVQDDRYAGLYKGSGGNKGTLWAIPAKSDVKKGDVIVTSGLKSVFPPGVVIGHVSEISKDANNLFLNIIVEPALEYSRLEQVLVIKNNPE